MALVSPRLHHVITDLQRRFGPQIIQSLREFSPARGHAVATGFADLDALLPTGGLPRGDLTHIDGGTTATLGVFTLALETAMRAGEVIVIIDGPGTFDADVAARRGLNLDHSLVIQPQTALQGLAMAHDLLCVAHLDALLIDGIPAGINLDRLLHAARQSHAVVLLTHAPPLAASGITLHLTHTGWVRHGDQIVGYRSEVCVVRSRYGPPGACAEITILLESIQARGWQ